MDFLNKKILIVEDTPEYELLIKTALGNSPNFQYVQTVKESITLLNENNYDLIILDLILPDGSGYDVLMKIKTLKNYANTPIVITSGKGEISDKVMGFNSGAVDYIVKPFNLIEFKARIENKLVFVDHLKNIQKIKVIGNMQLDANTLKTIIDDKSIDLTPLEFKLLKFFCDSSEQIFSRNQLLSNVWGDDTYVLDRTVDSTIANLRKKLKAWNYKIKSIYGMGYMLNKKAA